MFSIDKKASSETASLAAILGISSLSAGTMLMCSVLYAEDTQILILSTDYVSVFVLGATPAPAKLSALIGLAFRRCCRWFFQSLANTNLTTLQGEPCFVLFLVPRSWCK